MQRQPVKSTNLAEVGFEKETGTVEVKFVNGEIYRYGGVPEELYQSMLGSSSVGSFFAQYIKKAYPVRKVTTDLSDAKTENVVTVTASAPDKPTQREKNYGVLASFQDLATALKESKPNDQSPLDRHYAVSITELEKAFAYYFTYVVNGL